MQESPTTADGARAARPEASEEFGFVASAWHFGGGSTERQYPMGVASSNSNSPECVASLLGSAIGTVGQGSVENFDGRKLFGEELEVFSMPAASEARKHVVYGV
jgi:hypothetical protein